MQHIVAIVMILSVAVQDVCSETWCYCCDWTDPADVLECVHGPPFCIRCLDPGVACIGITCYRYVARNGISIYTLSRPTY